MAMVFLLLFSGELFGSDQHLLDWGRQWHEVKY